MSINKLLGSRRNCLILLSLIIILGLLLRFRHFDVCDPGNRGEIALGMVGNLPPLYHYLSVPVFLITGNYLYAPVMVNFILEASIILLLYFLGKLVLDRRFGLLFALLYAIYPYSILVSRFISPETTESFFIVAIIYYFVKIEVVKNAKVKLYDFVALFLLVVIGAFSKQQTLVIVAPLFIYGVFKHRLAIFRKPLYYILAFAPIPYLSFILAHPEMLAAIVIYFKQPAGQLSFQVKMLNLLRWVVAFGAFYVLIFALQFVKDMVLLVRKRVLSDVNMFFYIFFFVLVVFVIRTFNYYHLFSVPLLFFVSRFLFSIKRQIVPIIILCLLFVYSFLGFFLSIPYFSINTLSLCEQNSVQAFPLQVRLLDSERVPSKIFFNNNREYFKELFKDEKYIIVSGNFGQDIKYELPLRVFQSSVVNDPIFKEINYAFVVFPINATYQGVPAWDYRYSLFLLERGVPILNETYDGGRNIVLLKLFNHSGSSYEKSDVWRRSLESLNLEEGDLKV